MQPESCRFTGTIPGRNRPAGLRTVLGPLRGKSRARTRVVPRKGLEPSRPLSHWHLKPARLPIPPPGPAPVTTDRSRACQIANGHSNPLYSADMMAYRETAKLPDDQTSLIID